MTQKLIPVVGDVTLLEDEWVFALHFAPDHNPIVFAFKGRKEANVSRRLMKEIIARTAAVSPACEVQPAQIPVSWGELIDKITMLEIKRNNVESEDALANIRHELALLQVAAETVLAADKGTSELKSQLKAINEKLWHIENRIREKDALLEFDAEFVGLARAVLRTNDERSALKRAINTRLNSRIIEEKSYGLLSAGRRR